MRKLSFIAMLLISLVSFSSCAVMFGGTSYRANVSVDDKDVDVYYRGANIGTGQASTMIKRQDADNLTFVLKKDGFEDQTVNYNTATLRGWSIAGSILTWGLLGVAIDGVTGAWWKPNVDNPQIQKQDFKHYIYNVHYNQKK